LRLWRASSRPGTLCRLRSSEVLEAHYGWQPAARAYRHRKTGNLVVYRPQAPREPGGYRFTREAIGPARYMTARLALYRSLRRLGAVQLGGDWRR